MRVKRTFSVVALLSAVFILFVAHLSFAAPTEGDPKILTPQDRQNISGCTADPYPTLRKVYRKGDADGINKLNRDFACRLARFIQAYPQTCISSAYRSVARQAELYKSALARYGSPEKARKWVAPPGNSMHNKGLAADLCNIPAGARQAAGQFGLVFRMGHEPWHIEPSGAVKGDQPGGDPTGNTTFPTSGLTDQFRNLFANQPQQQQQQQPQSAGTPAGAPAGGAPSGAPASAPGAASPIGAPVGSPQPPLNGLNTVAQPANTCVPRLYCSGNNLYRRDSSCVDQLEEECTNGCANAKCLTSLSSILSDALKKAATGTADTKEREKDATSSASVFDQIINIAGAGETGTSSAPTDPFNVVIDESNAVALHGAGSSTMKSLDPGMQGGLRPPSAAQTFFSEDLRYSPSYLPSAETSGFRTTLAKIRDTLVNILAYLRPFGRPILPAGNIEEFVE